MNVYIYDNTYNGFISALCNVDNRYPFNIKSFNNVDNNLIDNYIYIKTDIDKSKLFLSKINETMKKNIYTVFLSNDKNKEIIIYNYIEKNDINSKIAIDKVTTYFFREAHKLKGFLRFKELPNKILYAEYKSENNVILLLGNHFKNRFKNEFFIINDVKRNTVLIYDKETIRVIKRKISCDIDDKFEDLWIAFFNSVSIKERENLKAQRNFMPKKYWQHITEVKKNERT